MLRWGSDTPYGLASTTGNTPFHRAPGVNPPGCRVAKRAFTTSRPGGFFFASVGGDIASPRWNGCCPTLNT